MKTALITGASSGFGRALIEELKEYKLVAIARRQDRLNELKNIYKERIHVINLDIRNEKEVISAINSLPEDFKDIHILFNNAGLALGVEEFDSLSLEDINTMIDTNIKGFLYIARTVLPLMRKQKDGYIFNVGSVAASNPYFGGNVYCGTKAFVGQFSKALRNDLRGSNIKVTTIAPGLCKTEFSEVRFKGDTQKADDVYKDTKALSPEDIAKTVRALLSLPNHVNVNEIELMPVTQSFNGFFIEKNVKL